MVSEEREKGDGMAVCRFHVNGSKVNNAHAVIFTKNKQSGARNEKRLRSAHN